MDILHIIEKPDCAHYDVLDAMLPYGVEAPVNDEGEIDEGLYHALIREAACTLSKAVTDGNRMRVYRAISVPDDWSPESLGVHWTHDKKRAYPYNGDPENYVIIEGLVPVDHINIPASLVLNMDLTENEVLLCGHAEIEIVSVTKPDGSASHSYLWGTTYQAGPPEHRPRL